MSIHLQCYADLANDVSPSRLHSALTAVSETGEFRWANGHANKLYQLKMFESEGIRTPPNTQHLDAALMWLHREHTVLSRKYTHSNGNDVQIALPNLPPPDGWARGDYWLIYIPFREEWRFHIFRHSNEEYLSIHRCKKYGGSHELLRGVDAQWSAAPHPPAGLREFAKRAVAATNYSYGAVDIIIPEDPEMYGEFVALEVNTAPQLDGPTLDAYVKAIRRYCAETRI